MKEHLLRRALGAVTIAVLVALSVQLPRAMSNPARDATAVSSSQASSSGNPGATSEMAVVGGTKANCDFAAGAGVGLGIAGLFGCVVCGGISLGLAAGVMLFC